MSTVERFVEAVEQTLPIDARVIKTLGDEVMVVGADPAALTSWAVGLQARSAPASRRRGSASTTARRSIATATTTAATSTRPRAWSRGPAAARCW